jgi:hypothetical protein
MAPSEAVAGMDGSLTDILSRIASGTLLPSVYLRSLDCDAALNARDGDVEFGTAWTQLFEEVDGQRVRLCQTRRGPVLHGETNFPK